ncbi:MAG TPA: hypothetical protein DCQ76_06610 [Ruminococcaceae bacterium]|nr:hypothetical protein [Oscillospiraceae bacterium]
MRKEKIKSLLFGLFITLFIVSALFIKMFIYVQVLNEHPTLGESQKDGSHVIAADNISQNIMP